MHSEFRGLLNADFREALMNTHMYDDIAKERSSIIQQRGVSAHSKKTATNVREVFPMPSALAKGTGKYTTSRA